MLTLCQTTTLEIFQEKRIIHGNFFIEIEFRFSLKSDKTNFSVFL